VAGASPPEVIKSQLEDAGFIDVRFEVLQGASEFVKGWLPGKKAEEFVTAAYLTGRRPATLEADTPPAKKLRATEVVSGG